MKRALTYTLAVALLLSLTACGTTQAEQPAEPEPATTSSQANEPITTPEPSEIPEPEQTPEPTATPEPSETPEPEQTPEPTTTPEPASTDTVEPQTLAQTEPAADPEPEQTLKPKQTTEPTTTPEPVADPEPAQTQTQPQASTGTEDYGLSAMLQYAAEHQGSGTDLENRPGTIEVGPGLYSNPDVAVDMN